MQGNGQSKSQKVSSGKTDLLDRSGMEDCWGYGEKGIQDKIFACQVCTSEISREMIERNHLCDGCALVLFRASEACC